MFRFSRHYALLTLLLFLAEVLIAFFIRDKIIRPYGGDFLVVILIYCAIRTFTEAPVWKIALGVLLFAYTVELTQYFHLINYFGLEHSTAAMLIMGKSFQWFDMLAYTLGIVMVLFLEWKKPFILKPPRTGIQ